MNNKVPANGSADPPARKADPCVMVIFGASGDLTKRKLVPALLNLAAAKLLPEQFAIIGFANIDQTTEGFRAGGSAEPLAGTLLFMALTKDAYRAFLSTAFI